tara:strand:- start:105 stop:458 length:354 start_codon:yes stop_codon:yes gene_type:complete
MGSKAYHAEYYRKNSAKAQAHKKRYEIRNKRFITLLKRISNCCKCGLKKHYLLEFHHVDPTTKYKNVTDLQFNAYSLERIKKEIRKCAILCRNCHMEYHHLEKQVNIHTLTKYITSE